MKDTPSTLKRVLIMAGGTGGHVFPGLAVAHCLRENGVEVHWLGTNQGLEARLVPEADFPLHVITISGLRGKGIKPLLAAPFKIATAVLQSRRIINQVNPDVVIGMGGFVSGPGGIASWLMRRPLIIHEQNAKAGLTNKVLARFAKKVLEGFPNAFRTRPRVAMTGNPVRTEIENLAPPEQRFNTARSPFRLLILGGSLGAQALNEAVPKALRHLPTTERPEVLHQTGDKQFELTKKTYESMNVEATLKPFIKDMAEAYAWADMVICRAGALTVAELCAAGLGAIFVPFPYAVDDHQTANAEFMVAHQAACCIQQTELTEERLADIVRQFAQSPEKRLAMAQAAYQLRRVRVAERIFDICKEVCR
ncbi:undecaprenyldiphospho-muramoylpentapeptide beta-N-acetylglucosaminyltransferase [Aquicella lusitana]|uniref:UDP-N-acetylglucosamine--N-acetylmuramyl-(pentapeptide) pyrophosphoryl-undecaprenol N-acetylglucosamine transferase n=1 Tax=Aquicella lusitana TaxID=254246 RepID=A0A370GNC1_9COXI|nr:undecaprenyldiphospho-muramoylpentapeptide beta-N-acetylglucosaminyltransferase [Aquicella lusitana]RDI44776.1 UDP-N-acetylglucosamine-N-acetylmuramylpentapeptide N-acetylglucosamine transferase [Aquicella lusitana]VVC72973.1 UDP-N-acetylglucosamine--N-acetylmuramyl-(pentapeptide) pyrophosphoryl-undecaprenol N-acetylglucosamine transferase [Aquicella lusitana]